MSQINISITSSPCRAQKMLQIDASLKNPPHYQQQPALDTDLNSHFFNKM